MKDIPPCYIDRANGKTIRVYNARWQDVICQFSDLLHEALLLTDPPYGIGESSARVAGRQRSSTAKANQRDYGHFGWDHRPCDADIACLIGSCPDSVIWGGNYFSVAPSPAWLVWDKDNGDNDYADCELAWTSATRAVRKFKWRWQGMLQERGGADKEPRWHPTQKPVPLFRWCLSLFDRPLIFDPYAGSGTAAIAAKLEGRSAIVCEIDPRYCEVIGKRLRDVQILF